MTEVTDRISVLSDAAAFASNGAGSTADVLALLNSFENESEYLVWRDVGARLHELQSLWFERPAEEREALDKLTSRLFGKQVQRLGWEFKNDEDFLTKQLRTLAIARAGGSGNQE
jgi:aminopeptidase N